MIIENNLSAFKYVPLRVKQRVNAEDLHKNYFIMAHNRAIPSAANTLENKICSALFKLFSSKFYNDKISNKMS